mmetsp:Transcript_26301/g.63343  ORF Transcript_26301/g.63343 Transcript_26301/m.63343 type:complete len:228 (-) Transcript_26301:603-1286(-)
MQYCGTHYKQLIRNTQSNIVAGVDQDADQIQNTPNQIGNHDQRPVPQIFPVLGVQGHPNQAEDGRHDPRDGRVEPDGEMRALRVLLPGVCEKIEGRPLDADGHHCLNAEEAVGSTDLRPGQHRYRENHQEPHSQRHCQVDPHVPRCEPNHDHEDGAHGHNGDQCEKLGLLVPQESPPLRRLLRRHRLVPDVVQDGGDENQGRRHQGHHKNRPSPVIFDDVRYGQQRQ